MDSSSKAWQPPGLQAPMSELLAVPAPKPPVTRGLYLSLLEAKLAELVEADPRAAKQALEMSQEGAPELWAIAEQYPRSQWASALVRSDSMGRLLAAVQWEQPGTLADPQPASLLEIAELLA